MYWINKFLLIITTEATKLLPSPLWRCARRAREKQDQNCCYVILFVSAALESSSEPIVPDADREYWIISIQLLRNVTSIFPARKTERDTLKKKLGNVGLESVGQRLGVCFCTILLSFLQTTLVDPNVVHFNHFLYFNFAWQRCLFIFLGKESLCSSIFLICDCYMNKQTYIIIM